ncbi:MAG: CoA-binding protein [Ginsengibacter sp.]
MNSIKKKTLVLGASTNPARYSNMAIKKLRQYGHEVVAIGLRPGQVEDVDINVSHPDINNLNTITLYLNPDNQKPYYDYILQQHPQRIVFNPGTENPELEQMAKAKGIQTQEACTLVLLSIDQY